MPKKTMELMFNGKTGILVGEKPADNPELNLSKFIQFLPNFFKESLKKSPNFLQQLLTIDNSKYTEKKTIL